MSYSVSVINNTQVDDAQDIDIVMPMYNLIEYIMLIQRYHEIYGSTVEMNQL